MKAGAGAGTEWAWELSSESLFKAVGVNGEGTVIKTQGIENSPGENALRA